MKCKFWGVRGSLPAPVRPEEIRSKITSVVQRIRHQDLESLGSRQSFIAGLPPWIFGSLGGNTPCVEIRLADNTCILMDAGSGIRDFAISLNKRVGEIRHFHVFFTHFHWDHIQGLPFFLPAFNPRNTVTFYSPVKGFRDILKNQMKSPYFPVTMDGAMQAKLNFVELDGEKVDLNNAEIRWKLSNHPDGAYAYKISENDRHLIYATDAELQEEDFKKNSENTAMFNGVDILILDTMYTLGEAIEKINWGHTAFSLGVDFAAEWKVKKLFLFHHEPQYDDKRLYKNLRSAQWYAKRLGSTDLEIHLAEEDLEFEV